MGDVTEARLVTTTLALSQKETVESMRKPRDEERSYVLPAILLVVIAALTVAAVRIAIRFIAMLRLPGADRALFDELARAHRLSRAERKALLRLVRREELDPPARVFIETDPLRAYAGTDAVYDRLYDRLFG